MLPEQILRSTFCVPLFYTNCATVLACHGAITGRLQVPLTSIRLNFVCICGVCGSLIVGTPFFNLASGLFAIYARRKWDSAVDCAITASGKVIALLFLFPRIQKQIPGQAKASSLEAASCFRATYRHLSFAMSSPYFRSKELNSKSSRSFTGTPSD